LPSDLAPLTRRHAVSIDPVSFNTDRLFATLSDSLSPRPEPPKPTRGVQPPGPGFAPARTEKPAPRPDAGAGGSPAPNRRGILIGAAALVLALIVGTLVWRPWAGGGSATPSAPSTSAAATSSPPSATPSAQVTEQPVLGGGPLAIMAHRGGQEKHQLQTLKAMEAAARDGFSIETDVRYTSDRVAVMVHDEEATKGLDCGGKDIRVGQTTWKVLKATCRSKPTAEDPVSYAIPTFAQTMEAISAASPTAWVFPEIKNNLTIAQTKEFLAVITNAGMRERTVLTSFTAARLERVKQVDPEMPTLLMMIGKAVPVSQLEGMGLWGVGVDQAVATPDYVKRLKAQNLKVMVWLLNDSRQWATAKSLGADVVMTDFPAKYRAWEQEQ
jgi:glycerophosphoryl diester phosphodiesterase